MASEEDEERGGFWASFPGLKNIRNYKWLSTLLVLAFLIAGGFVAWFTMKNAANKLAGGGNYNSLSANSAPYGEGSAAKTEKEEGFFASEEELAKADPALQKEFMDNSAAAALPVSGKAGGAGGGNFNSASGGGSASRSPAQGSGLAYRLNAGAIHLGQMNGGQASKAMALRPEEMSGGVSAATAQSKNGAPGGGLAKGPKMSVMEALKSAFKANLYGARLASQDSAKSWIAKAFDANHDAQLSLEYDEKVKAKLDRVNPGSIPNFLRDQNMDATDAKSLGVSSVGKPELDKEGTKEALKEDKDYQEKKGSRDLAKALFTPLGPFTGSGNTGDNPAADAGQPSAGPGNDDVESFSNPDDAQTLQDIGKEEYIDTEGYGAECGCKIESACCCLPPDSANGQPCPMYGPFLPDDPCGAGLYDGAPVGDFPANTTGTLPA
ncbi:MAG: hypothetical protein WCK75_01255 [Elusimicrobiota bacterium]